VWSVANATGGYRGIYLGGGYFLRSTFTAAIGKRSNFVTREKFREPRRIKQTACRVPAAGSRPGRSRIRWCLTSSSSGRARLDQDDADLLARGLSPASHFSLNLHEPVTAAAGRFNAKKVFIEGDAIVLAIFETESTVAYARAVAKACVLSRTNPGGLQFLQRHGCSSQLPALESALAWRFKAPHQTYWTDGESRIMIFQALNLSDRLSGCASSAKRMLSKQKSQFAVYHFLTAMEGASAEELDEFLVRYTLNGIELNEEGFQKLARDFAGNAHDQARSALGKGEVCLYYGEVPMGNPSSCWCCAKPRTRMLPDGKIGKPSDHNYYEVCTSQALYDLVAALKRTQNVGLEATRPELSRLAGHPPYHYPLLRLGRLNEAAGGGRFAWDERKPVVASELR